MLSIMARRRWSKKSMNALNAQKGKEMERTYHATVVAFCDEDNIGVCSSVQWIRNRK